MGKMLFPIGIQDFEYLRKGGFVYVDKTRHIHELARTGKYYFLGRPRRFGKSLLVSTMAAYFSGKRELFAGLDIERLEKEWTAHPVLYLDLNTGKYDDKESLNKALHKTLYKWEQIYGSSPEETTLEYRFEGIVERASRQSGKGVVILVDEYDKPLLQTMGNKELQDEHRKTLKAFYSVMKSQDKYIRFALLTGVTKFGKISVFSDLNNLDDISMDARYYDICGITEAEMRDCLDGSVKELARSNGMSDEQAYAKLKEQYDGYHFEAGTPGIYNPFSLLNALSDMKFNDYWFETGTPTFLVELLKRSDYDLKQLRHEEQETSILGSIEGIEENPIPIIYQAGYLTIKGYDSEFGMYTLGFPNKEVEQGFLKYLLPYYLPVSNSQAVFAIKRFVQDVRGGNPEAFLTRLKALFSGGNFKIAGEMEKYYQNAVFLIFTFMGFYTEVEHCTSCGCIDIVLKTKDYIYIIECKFDKSAEEAVAQIDSKGYADPYAADPRKLFKIGINFSSKTRAIDGYLVK